MHATPESGNFSSGSGNDGDKSDLRNLPQRVAHVRDNFWQKLRKVLARAPFAPDLVAAYYCMMDPATPMRAKAILASALAYFILPVDAVPDFILGLGLTDDAAVLAAAIAAVRGNIKEHHRKAARTALDAMAGKDEHPSGEA